ncbi:MAG: hypothetical protein H0T79_20985, partial [Deltaproteobacteria bacterium]|nr:hypothetical protein [Deltaproteobacteria bacterium]
MRTGMFLQIATPFAVGTQIRIAITLDGRRYVTGARVAHILTEAEARVLGRRAGMGIAYRDPT